MSTLTQRKCLEGVRFGSAAYVVEHARWRKSRGKKPSLSFNGLSNPKLAFILANKEFNKLIDLTSYWLDKFRGDDPAIYQLNFFRDGFLKSGKPLSYFGTNEEELKKLERKIRSKGSF